MKKIIITITILSFMNLIGCSSGSDAIKNKNMNQPGAEVFIETNDGVRYTGELLSVQDSVMILCEKYNASERDLADSVYAIFFLKNHDLKSIELKGKSKAVYGIIFGSVIGAGIGITGKKDFFDDTITGCCVGGLVGAMVGGIIGLIITNDEVVYEYANPDEFDFTQLNIYARYGSEEPGYL
jgi:hypothetical protein